MDAIGNDLGCNLRIGKHSAQHASLAMGERPHSIEDVDGMAYPVLDSDMRLLIGGVGMPHGDDNTGGAGAIDDLHSSTQFRRNCQNAGASIGCFEETLEG